MRADIPAATLRPFLPRPDNQSISGSLSCDLTVFGAMDKWEQWRIAGNVAADNLVILDSAWAFDSLVLDWAIDSDGIMPG